MKDESDGRNGDKYVTMQRNFWSSVGVPGGSMFCLALTLEASGCAHSLSYIHPKKVTDGCLTTHFPPLNIRLCS